MSAESELTVDDLAQEIRRVDGSNSFGAGSLAEALMPFLASRLPRQEDEIRKAALEEATASARFARLMGISRRIIWSDLGKPAMQNAQTQAALQELSEFVFQDALEEAHRVRALSQKGDEADG